jgi:hypothetical protein
MNKYNFSFTAFSLRVSLVFKYATALHEGNSMQLTEIGNGNKHTGQKRSIEIKKRVAQFTDKEFELFVAGDFVTQKQLAFLSVCKAHNFIRDFVVEVPREKTLLFDNEITEGDYISFYRRKEELHPEMDDLTDRTQSAIRQVTFKILEEAGIIDSTKTKVIQYQILDEKLIEAIVDDNAQWLKVFLMSDIDINNWIDKWKT